MCRRARESKAAGLRLFRDPFGNTALWTAIFLLVISILRFGHLLRGVTGGVTGAMLALSAQMLCLVVVLLIVRVQSRKELGFVKFKPGWWFISIGGGLIMGASLALTNRFLLPSSWDWIIAMDKSLLPEAWRALHFGFTEIGLALIGGVLTPLAEEFFFRGLLITAWRDRLGLWTTLVLQSLLFGFLHLAHVGVEIFPQFSVDPGLAANIFITTALGGLLFGLIRVRSGSIWPAVLAHAAVNLAAAVI